MKRILLSLLFIITVMSNMGLTIEPVYIGKFKRTGYCKCNICCGKWSKYNKTAYGYIPEERRTMAIDPRVLKPRYWYIVKQQNNIIDTLRAEDTGNPKYIFEYHIDQYFKEHKDCQHIRDSVEIWQLSMKII